MKTSREGEGVRGEDCAKGCCDVRMCVGRCEEVVRVQCDLRMVGTAKPSHLGVAA